MNITLYYYDDEGDVCSIKCKDRAVAIKRVKDVEFFNKPLIGWAFTIETGTEKDYDIHTINELQVN